jgi:hypothetical protein
VPLAEGALTSVAAAGKDAALATLARLYFKKDPNFYKHPFWIGDYPNWIPHDPIWIVFNTIWIPFKTFGSG